MPKFAEVAKAYSLKGYRVENFEDLQNLLISLSNSNEAVLIDVNVVENENCYPMVAPGRSNSQMLGLEKE
jgi:acetolactate synthase-1/2/3 large subunit